MIEQLALDDVAIFLAVAECESFISAARRLGVPQSSVSRRVATLESKLGVLLLKRTTRSFDLTPEGQRLFEACASPIAQVKAALSNVAADAIGASETLTVSLSPYICPQQFRAWVSEFGSEWPEVRLNLLTSSHGEDSLDDVDLAIRFGSPNRRNLDSVKLYDVPFRLVASPELIRRSPSSACLKDPEALLVEPCAALLPITSWSFTSRTGEHRTVTPTKLAAASNDPWITADAVRQGKGIGLLPEAFIDEHLMPITIDGWSPVASSVHAVFPRSLRESRKIRSALESLRRQGSKDAGRDSVRDHPRSADAVLA